MAKIFAVNAGSSSLKFSIYEVPSEEVIASGLIDRIGLNDSNVIIKFNGEKHTEVVDIPDHDRATEILLDRVKSLGIVTDFDEIVGSGHRIVAGGERFKESELLDEAGIKAVEDLSPFAPLHNPAEAKVIRAFQKVLPGKPVVGVFDTSFHTTMPEKAYLYPVPYEWYTELSARKYGAHGTSHKYVSEQAAKLLGKPIEDTKIITCHIGNGASMTAVQGGKSVDTSMGFTPLAGLMMGTRCGDVDTSLLQYVMKEKNMDIDEMIASLNNKSGLLGVSGISSDMRDVQAARGEGDKRSTIALGIYTNRVKQYIGSYLATMNGADAIVFTAGVGENSPEFRKEVLEDMEFFGIELDDERNNTERNGLISSDNSKVAVYVIPTDEELMIVRDVVRLGDIHFD